MNNSESNRTMPETGAKTGGQRFETDLKMSDIIVLLLYASNIFLKSVDRVRFCPVSDLTDFDRISDRI